MLQAQTDYFTVTKYICTLNKGCIKNKEDPEPKTNLGFIPSAITLTQQFEITAECMEFVTFLMSTNDMQPCLEITVMYICDHYKPIIRKKEVPARCVLNGLIVSHYPKNWTIWILSVAN